jgi:hypothetical protein
MKIQFLYDIELEIIESLDENGDVSASSLEDFVKGQTLEVDLIEESGGRTQFQTGEGSVFFIEDDSFKEVE